MVAPYLHFYFARDLLAKHKSRLQSQKEHINLLLGYLSNEFGSEFKEAEDLFSRGLVTRKHFHKLFGPREVLATMNGAGHQIAMVSRYPPLPGSDPIRVECEIMDFNGSFKNGRYMVDVETYHRSCGESKSEDPNTDEFVAQLRITDFDQFTPPPTEEFVLLMPPTIYGFGFHDKQWRKLDVRFTAEILWNDRVFEMLVLLQEEKDILSASVLKSTSSHELEIVSGRGPSVVILLHGEHGTGKTFAAEALAELSRRPLYRLTSSDIGIELKEVERNLSEAFYLGGIWDAIMLIDDCDVYLERRGESDFSRNAVVSFVLQALDYHQGIIILTSKGSFLDPALRPRVHVSCDFNRDDD
ncbi:Ff.00g043180.m01.CDS01 [Fusarium sp. VM40]|nr:Ff.00g043180.m01.CDS01 [Fusarium sp. VM40]